MLSVLLWAPNPALKACLSVNCQRIPALVSGYANWKFRPVSSLTINAGVNAKYLELNGNYAVEVTLGSCVEVSNCINFNTLNTTEFNKETVEVYPNPVTSILNIRLPESINKAKLSIVTIEGKELLRKVIDKPYNEIEFSQFSNGIYFVNIKSNGRTLSYKVVKE